MSTIQEQINGYRAALVKMNENGRSLRRLARESGMATKTLHDFMRGQSINTSTLQRIESFLHRSITTLPAQKLTPSKGDEASP